MYAGTQFAQLIDRCVRERNMYSELLPLETSVYKLKEEGFKAGGNTIQLYTSQKLQYTLFVNKDMGVPLILGCFLEFFSPPNGRHVLWVPSLHWGKYLILLGKRIKIQFFTREHQKSFLILTKYITLLLYSVA